MKKKFVPLTDTLMLTLGEILVSLLVVGGYLAYDLIFEASAFSYRVITGALLGTAVIVLNYLFLTLALNRAINRFMAIRGTAEMDDESAMQFATQNMAPIQKTIALSFIIRTVSMLAALVIAFVLNWFAPIATLIPILAFRPILTVTNLLRSNMATGNAAIPLGAEFKDISADEHSAEEGTPLIEEEKEDSLQ